MSSLWGRYLSADWQTWGYSWELPWVLPYVPDAALDRLSKAVSDKGRCWCCSLPLTGGGSDVGGTDADGNFIQMQHMGHVPKSSWQAALLATLGGFLPSHFKRGYDPADNLLGACYSLRF